MPNGCGQLLLRLAVDRLDRPQQSKLARFQANRRQPGGESPRAEEADLHQQERGSGSVG